MSTTFANAETGNPTGLAFLNAISVEGDGWAHLAPFGDFPGLATEVQPDGTIRRFTAVQRLDRESADSMVTAFKSPFGKLKRWLRQLPVYLGHPDVPGMSKRYPNTKAVGSIADIAVRENGLWVKPAFGNEAVEAVDRGDVNALSGYWEAAEVAVDGDKKIFRPMVLKSVGFTNKPNLPVELFNEMAAEGEETTTCMNRDQLIALLKKLGIAFANTDNDEQLATKATEAPVTIANELATARARVTELEGIVATRDGTITTLTGDRDAQRTAFNNERAARIDERLDAEIAAGRITQAQRDEFKGKLTANFANAIEELGKIKPLKTKAGADANGRRAAMANSADRINLIQEAVKEKVAKGATYDAAFESVQREKPELFASN